MSEWKKRTNFTTKTTAWTQKSGWKNWNIRKTRRRRRKKPEKPENKRRTYKYISKICCSFCCECVLLLATRLTWPDFGSEHEKRIIAMRHIPNVQEYDSLLNANILIGSNRFMLACQFELELEWEIKMSLVWQLPILSLAKIESPQDISCSHKCMLKPQTHPAHICKLLMKPHTISNQFIPTHNTEQHNATQHQ